MTTDASRLSRLRATMAENGIDAYICPVSNRFLTKFLQPSENLVAWLTGAAPRISYGTVVVTATDAALFTAPLYEEMVRAEVDPAVFKLFTDGTEDMFAWLDKVLQGGKSVAYDPWLYSIEDSKKLSRKAADAGLGFVPASNILPCPEQPAFKPTFHALEFAGTSTQDKFKQVCEQLSKSKQDRFLITHGPSLSWLLNVRIPDDDRNPTLRAYGLIHVETHTLTLYDDVLTPDFIPEFVRLRPLSDIDGLITELGDTKIAVDAYLTPAAFLSLNTTPLMDPCLWLKAKKNAVEQACIRQSHIVDAVALCKTLAWIDTAQNFTEWDVVEKLNAERAQSNLFRGISFEPIVGFNSNGASIHHATRVDNAQPIQGNGLLLLDSGGQYDNGTTDVTRTVAIGTPTPEMKLAWTHVLKSHIALSSCTFPEGTTGAQLDGVARAPLWQAGLDYRHGTGHGVGFWLNVHEGPFSISGKCTEGIVPNLLLSIEPGYYKSGAFGIRLENLALVVQDKTPNSLDKPRLKFDPVTLAPFDTRCLMVELLNEDERYWLNRYHTRVREEIMPHLDASTQAWILNALKEI